MAIYPAQGKLGQELRGISLLGNLTHGPADIRPPNPVVDQNSGRLWMIDNEVTFYDRPVECQR